jgi:hypothetical protein
VTIAGSSASIARALNTGFDSFSSSTGKHFFGLAARRASRARSPRTSARCSAFQTSPRSPWPGCRGRHARR